MDKVDIRKFLYLFAEGKSAWEILHAAYHDAKFEPNRTEDERKQALADFLNDDLFLTNFEKQDKQYSQRRHAKIRGFDAGSYNNWINANRLPDSENLFQLALVYGPIVYDIIGVRVAANMNDPRTRLALEYFSGLDDEGKRAALKKLKAIKEGVEAENDLHNVSLAGV